MALNVAGGKISELPGGIFGNVIVDPLGSYMVISTVHPVLLVTVTGAHCARAVPVLKSAISATSVAMAMAVIEPRAIVFMMRLLLI
jgi:hypothetical protein